MLPRASLLSTFACLPCNSLVDNYRGLIVTWTVGVFAMLIPIWLGTTAVYRASLPFDSIAQWDKAFQKALHGVGG